MHADHETDAQARITDHKRPGVISSLALSR